MARRDKMFVSKWNSLTSKLKMAGTIATQVQKIKCLVNVFYGGRKLKTPKTEDTSQKLSKILRKQKHFVRNEQKRTELSFNIGPPMCLTSEIKKRRGATEMRFARRVLRISFIEHVSNDKTLQKMKKNAH